MSSNSSVTSSMGAARTSRALRIAMSSYYLPSESKIGAGYQAHNLAQAMSFRGHDVTMFSPCSEPDNAVYRHRLVPVTGSLRTFRWPVHLRRLDFESFDIYHAAGDDYFLAGRQRPAHVRTLYGSCLAEAKHISGAKARLRMALLGLSEIASTGVADRSVGCSANTLAWFPWVHTVVPAGVDRKLLRPADTRPSEPTILFVGTYKRRKRGRLLMDAFAREVLPRIPEARLRMVCSDAPDAPGVDVLGRLSDDELAEEYRSAWVFCLPSTYEGFGVPYIEAMASGTPVVATPNPGSLEVLERGRLGVVVEADELGNALADLLLDEQRRHTMSERGLEAAEQYGWHTVCQQYEAIYYSLLDDPPRRTGDSSR